MKCSLYESWFTSCSSLAIMSFRWFVLKVFSCYQLSTQCFADRGSEYCMYGFDEHTEVSAAFSGQAFKTLTDWLLGGGDSTYRHLPCTITFSVIQSVSLTENFAHWLIIEISFTIFFFFFEKRRNVFKLLLNILYGKIFLRSTFIF